MHLAKNCQLSVFRPIHQQRVQRLQIKYCFQEKIGILYRMFPVCKSNSTRRMEVDHFGKINTLRFSGNRSGDV
ncbi:hypothetical protein D3C87_1967800 [compost metagenome]